MTHSSADDHLCGFYFFDIANNGAMNTSVHTWGHNMFCMYVILKIKCHPQAY
jgi:hypothetical protein